MEKKEKLQYGMLFLADLCSTIISGAVTWFYLSNVIRVLPSYAREEQIQFYLILLSVFMADFLCLGTAEGFPTRGWKMEFLVCARFNLALGAGMATVMLLTKAGVMDSRYLFVYVVVVNLVLQFLVRLALKNYLKKSFYKGNFATLVGVITVTDRAQALVDSLKDEWMFKVQGVVLLDWDKKLQKVGGIPVVADYDTFMDWMRHEPLDEIYINIPYQTGESLAPVLHEIESMGISLHLNMPQLEQLGFVKNHEGWMPKLQPTLEVKRGGTFIIMEGVQHTLGDMILKRGMDIVGSLIGLLISVPIIAITAIPLKLESPGPLFFKQKRVGLNGRVFYIYKLRSMYVDAEEHKKELMNRNKMNGLMFKMDNDPRITKVGRVIRRLSIDELPQFWNVLLGDMSLVGTRPPTLDEYARYESHHKRRLSMKPGITGLWQVSGRSNIQDFEEVVRLDTTYIDNWSLGLDIKILIKTIGVVFARSGAE